MNDDSDQVYEEQLYDDTESDFYLRKIHKSRFIKKNIIKSAAFYTAFKKYSFAQFFLGFAIAGGSVLLSESSLEFLHNMLFLMGWAVGFTTPITVVCASYTAKKLSFLSRLVTVIRQNEVVYLYDDCFNGIDTKNKIILAQNLVGSQNLSAYELIDNMALEKIKLHLSPKSIHDFIKIQGFGRTSRISAERLLVLESQSLIKDDSLKSAIKEDENSFYEDKKLVNFHEDKCLDMPLKNTLALHKKYKNMRPISMAVGLAVIVASFTIVLLTDFYPLLALFFIGFVIFFSCSFFDMKAAEINKNYLLALAICDKINLLQTVLIADSCMDGLSFDQRITTIEKLIKSKNIVGKKLCFSKIIVPVEYSDDKAQQRLDKFAKDKLDAFISANNLKRIRIKEAATNCAYCGGALKENTQFCVFCGKKIIKAEIVVPPVKNKKSSAKKRSAPEKDNTEY